MRTVPLQHIRDLVHAQVCYQFFITPFHTPLEKKYKPFVKMACEFVETKRSEIIHLKIPRHYVLHRFSQKKNSKAKKVLIAHGWLSRAAYMVSLIKSLHREGYDVYALDFPAHGEAQGFQLPWFDAVTILKNILNQQGPFYAVVGHSFGGSMLLNTLNLSGQLTQCQLNNSPERAVLIASPIHMRYPVLEIARRFKLSGEAYLHLRQLIQPAEIDLNRIQLRRFITQTPEIPFLCIHGENDATVNPKESILFCKQYKNAQLELLKDADHVNVLVDDRVEALVSEFLSP